MKKALRILTATAGNTAGCPSIYRGLVPLSLYDSPQKAYKTAPSKPIREAPGSLYEWYQEAYKTDPSKPIREALSSYMRGAGILHA